MLIHISNYMMWNLRRNIHNVDRGNSTISKYNNQLYFHLRKKQDKGTLIIYRNLVQITKEMIGINSKGKNQDNV